MRLACDLPVEMAHDFGQAKVMEYVVPQQPQHRESGQTL